MTTMITDAIGLTVCTSIVIVGLWQCGLFNASNKPMLIECRPTIVTVGSDVPAPFVKL